MNRLFLLRYDTEAADAAEMAGFFETVLRVHREHRIPATFFCTGRALDAREADFRRFHAEAKGDPLFDIQDHSYSHIGIAYERNPELAVTRADYERSFAAHERVFGVRPIGVSLCGTSGRDGERLKGFDATPKARAELDMLASLGVRMVNTLLLGHDESREFIDYGAMGRPEIMGFPSAFSDTDWLYKQNYGDPLKYVFGLIEERAARGEHMPLMLHDWCAWKFWPGGGLGHVPLIAQKARECGFKLVTHVECLRSLV